MNGAKKIDNKQAKFLQLLPNEAIQFTRHNNDNFKRVVVSSNIFVDVDVVFDNDIIIIHIVGKPPVKEIIYG